MNLMMLITSIIVMAVLYYEARNATKPNKNIILGVMIPPLEVKNKEVLYITQEFMKNIKILFIVSLIIYFPLMLLRTTFLIIMWFIWFAIIYYVYYKLICKYNSELKGLKQKNNWLLPNKQILNIDTELTKAKGKMPISKWWFIIALFIGIIPFIMNLFNRAYYDAALICGGTSLVSIIILFVVYMIYARGRNIVYCDESEINIACNKIYKRTWSIVYTLLAIIQSIVNTTIYLFMLLPKVNENVFLVAIISPVLIIVLGIMYGNKRIIESQNKLISSAKNPIFVDSDEYWINGIFYKNPYDTRVVVEPRIGTKSVYNLATKKGKLITYGLNGFAIVSVVLIAIMILVFELYGFNMKINNGLVEIKAPQYGIEFNISDIEDVELIDDIKVKLRTNGIGTEEYSVGNFTVEGYGKCKLYLYNDIKPIILIKVNDSYVFINGETKEETIKYYNDLEEVLE